MGNTPFKKLFPNHVTMNEFAKLTNVSYATIRTWVIEKKIRTEKVNIELIPRSEVTRIKKILRENPITKGPKKRQ